jgi:hypothetical protein
MVRIVEANARDPAALGPAAPVAAVLDTVAVAQSAPVVEQRALQPPVNAPRLVDLPAFLLDRPFDPALILVEPALGMRVSSSANAASVIPAAALAAGMAGAAAGMVAAMLGVCGLAAAAAMFPGEKGRREAECGNAGEKHEPVHVEFLQNLERERSAKSRRSDGQGSLRPAHAAISRPKVKAK